MTRRGMQAARDIRFFRDILTIILLIVLLEFVAIAVISGGLTIVVNEQPYTVKIR